MPVESVTVPVTPPCDAIPAGLVSKSFVGYQHPARRARPPRNCGRQSVHIHNIGHVLEDHAVSNRVPGPCQPSKCPRDRRKRTIAAPCKLIKPSISQACVCLDRAPVAQSDMLRTDFQPVAGESICVIWPVKSSEGTRHFCGNRHIYRCGAIADI